MMELTAEQRAVVEAVRGPALVLAPVGSGKTTVLAHRALGALREGMDPTRCLCLTFTNRAARELRDRLILTEARDLPDNQNPADIQVFTFHGFCSFFLREEAATADLRSDFSIYDETDSIELLQRQLLLQKAKEDDPFRAEGYATDVYHRWGQALSSLKVEQVRVDGVPAAALQSFQPSEKAALAGYLRELSERGAVDFALLIYRSRALLLHDKDLAERWQTRFDWLQVDEVQDTHASEWDVVSSLASRHQNLALFGDLDQTIYGWRGSQPEHLLKAFRTRFPEAAEYHLSLNQRGTRAILKVADHIAAGMEARITRVHPAEHLPEGEAVEWITGDSLKVEAELLAKRLASLQRRDAGSIAVLARSGNYARIIREALAAAGLSAVTETELRFTRRPEVRALLAPLRLLENPDNLGALRTWLVFTGSKAPGLHEALLALYRYGRECQLLPGDLLNPACSQVSEPWAPLIHAWEERFYIVLDFETTGLDTERDEIVEIAAKRYCREMEIDSFHCLLRVSRWSSAAEQVHCITKEQVDKEGMDPAEGLRDLLSFINGDLVVGHNLGFDLAILRTQCARFQLPYHVSHSVDTLQIARRILGTGSMRLGDLRKRLNLPTLPTHRAMDDITTTAELLQHLMPALLSSREDREDLVRKYAGVFKPWAERLRRWRDAAFTLAPWELVRSISEDKLFTQVLKEDDPRWQGVRMLIQWFRALEEEEGAGPVFDSMHRLHNFVSRCMLSRPIDLLQEGTIPVLTIHASKGMEFDTVALFHLAPGSLPHFHSDKGAALEEERRVCYVAVTRPRKRLLLSTSRYDRRGRPLGWSPFVEDLAPAEKLPL